MVWVDRAGLGLWAIGLVVVAVLLFSGFLGPLTQQPSNVFDKFDKSSSFFLPSEKDPFSDLDKTVASDHPKGALLVAGEVAVKMTAFVVLPLWPILRIIDFIFGGPARRRSRRQAIARTTPNA